MSPLDAAGFCRLVGGPLTEGQPGGLSIDANFPPANQRRRIASRLLKSWSDELYVARDSLTDPKAVKDLGDFPLALAFSHMIAPRRLVDAMKKARMGQRSAARNAAAEMLTECLEFLATLGGELVD
jgi:hypothetical protein